MNGLRDEAASANCTESICIRQRGGYSILAGSRTGGRENLLLALDPKIVKKGLEFALEGDHQLLVVVGSPTQESMFLVNRCTCSHWEEYVADFEGNVSEEDVLQVMLEGLRSSGAVQFSTAPLARGFTLSYSSLPPYDDHCLQDAFLKAKQARFGFGSD